MKVRLLVAALSLVSLSAWAVPVDELMRKGDAYDLKLDAANALKYYTAAEKEEPKNVKLLTRMARQYRHLMQDTDDKSEKLRLGYVALDYSHRAATLGPKDAEAQLSVAISYGKMLPLLGSKEQVEASPKIKVAVDKAIALDPDNDLAWHILGRWNRVLADVGSLKRTLAGALYGKLPTGSLTDAEQYLRKAVELNPNRLMHYVELGRIYAQMGRKEDARKYLAKGLAMPNLEKDDEEIKRLGKEAMEKVK